MPNFIESEAVEAAYKAMLRPLHVLELVLLDVKTNILEYNSEPFKHLVGAAFQMRVNQHTHGAGTKTVVLACANQAEDLFHVVEIERDKLQLVCSGMNMGEITNDKDAAVKVIGDIFKSKHVTSALARMAFQISRQKLRFT